MSSSGEDCYPNFLGVELLGETLKQRPGSEPRGPGPWPFASPGPGPSSFGPSSSCSSWSGSWAKAAARARAASTPRRKPLCTELFPECPSETPLCRDSKQIDICGGDLREAEIQKVSEELSNQAASFELKLRFGQETGHLRIYA